MKSSHLQSLSKRVKNALAGIHAEIRLEADSLIGSDDHDRPIYSTLSRLQRERKKLEALQASLKRELKIQVKEENMVRALAKAGFEYFTVQCRASVDTVNEHGVVVYNDIKR